MKIPYLHKKLFSFLVLSIFVGILLSINVVSAADEWYYTMKGNQNNQVTNGPYATQAECQTFQALAQSTDVITPCYLKPQSVPVNAQQPTTGTQTSGVYNLLAPIGNITSFQTNNIGSYFNMIFKLAIGLCAALAVIMIIISSIQYMGDESVFGKTEAKSKIISAIMGLLIALGAYALLNTLNPALTGSGGLSVNQVVTEVVDITSPTYQHISSKSGTTKASISTWQNQAWHDAALTAVNASSLPSLTPTDTATWFPGVTQPTAENWVGLLAGMAKAESNFNQDETYTENFKDKNGVFVVSTGLFQISQESARPYGFPNMTTVQLKDPIKNIQVAVKILEWWVKRDKVIAATTTTTPKYLGGARYWSVLRVR